MAPIANPIIFGSPDMIAKITVPLINIIIFSLLFSSPKSSLALILNIIFLYEKFENKKKCLIH